MRVFSESQTGTVVRWGILTSCSETVLEIEIGLTGFILLEREEMFWS